MNKVIKIILFMLIIFTILFSFTNKTYALSSIIEQGQDFIETGKSSGEAGNGNADFEGDLEDLSGYLYNILLGAGVIIAVIIATILGVQFIIGGAEGQAKVKERLIPFIAGCVVVFGGFGFWKLGIELGKRIDNVQSTSTYVKTEEDIEEDIDSKRSSTHRSSSGVTHGGGSREF